MSKLPEGNEVTNTYQCIKATRRILICVYLNQMLYNSPGVFPYDHTRTGDHQKAVPTTADEGQGGGDPIRVQG